jgi:triosephosphate isomerase
MPRRCWVGGNFKSAATLAMVHAQIKVLNEGGAFPANVDVVIAPSALHIPAALAAARPEVTVAIQNIHTAKVSGVTSVCALSLSLSQCPLTPPLSHPPPTHLAPPLRA